MHPLGIVLSLLLAQLNFASEKTSVVADGELHSCQWVTVDKAWAVGDRGLILYSGDAGKHWEVQHQRFDSIYYAVCFSDEQFGCVVGGTIEPYSHRSVGVISTTMDGGKSWQSVPNELPRLIGAQQMEAAHILAWGDWSTHHQSALFESTDGGYSWAARPTPCGHIQSAAVGMDGVLIVVDRAGRIHRSLTGLEYELVDLPGTPFEPIRFCKMIEGIWWLGGDSGNLFRSRDAVRWEPILLPGSSDDRMLYSLSDATGFGNRIWVVGQPGSVVWNSDDQGKTWSVNNTTNRTAINSISVLNGDLLLTCGPMANLFASRNGGKAWWPLHQSGSRNSVLNISSTCSGVAWDLLTQVVHEYKRHASALVLHDQCFEERARCLPELASRFEIAGKAIGLSQSRMLASFPVGNLYSGFRASDLGYYVKPVSETNAISKRLVFEIRNGRPDVVVSNCSTTGNALEVKSALAVELACSLAARRDYKVFSNRSGIVEEAWEPQRILVRGASPEMQYSQSMLLQSSELVLGSLLAPIKPLIESRGAMPTPEKRYSYRVAGSRSSVRVDSPLTGIVLDQETQGTERTKTSQRLSVLPTSKWYGWRQLIDSESGNQLTPDRVWDSKVRAAAKDVPINCLASVLMEIAVQCRRNGDWNRWQSALEFLLEKDSQSPAAEAAYWELMMHTGSIEVKRMMADQLLSLEKRSTDGMNASATTLQQASPFAKIQQDASSVQPASFVNSVRLIPIATNRDLQEFTRVLSKWPDTFSSRRTEPRWAWLISSRYREMQQRNESANATVNLARSHTDFWPTFSPFVHEWNSVAKAERIVFNQATAPPQLMPSRIEPSKATGIVSELPIISRATERPYLDGKAIEKFWNNAIQMELRDPWANASAKKTLIKLARDDEFLYIFSQAPKAFTSQPSINKRTDVIKSESDQIRLKIDLDRDYASWFEIGWSASGESVDSVNDMPQWNPQWHAANHSDNQDWFTEIAIPLDQLIVAPTPTTKNWKKEVWAFNATRSIPNVATHSMSPSIADRTPIDDWFLLDLNTARDSQK